MLVIHLTRLQVKDEDITPLVGNNIDKYYTRQMQQQKEKENPAVILSRGVFLAQKQFNL